MADEDKLIISGDASSLVKATERGAEALNNLGSAVGKTDAELNSHDRTVGKVASTLKELSGALATASANSKTQAGASNEAASGLKRYGSEASEVITQLNALAAAQDKVTGGKLAALDLPTKLPQGKSANGQFTQADARNSSTKDLLAMKEAYDLQGQSLQKVVNEELALRDAIKSADAAQQAAIKNSKYLPGVDKSTATATTTAKVQPVKTDTGGLTPDQLAAMGAAYARTTTAVAKNNRAMDDEARSAVNAAKAESEKRNAVESTVGADNNAAVAAKNLAAANDVAAKSSGNLRTASISTRYALYDVSNTFGIAGAAVLGADVAIVKTAIDFEKSFSSVARTSHVTGAAADELRSQFEALSQTLPVSFEDLTSIGALGAQLGIAAKDLTGFTKTVAEFSATTNLTVDASATALGRLSQLLPDVGSNYDSLASSILKVGVNSVATESQIVNIATQIAGIASSAHFTSQAVVGLSGALASVGVQPELARGLITRLFTNISVAVAQGGKSLQNFADVSGTSAADFANQWKNAPDQALTALLSGIQTNGGASIATIQALGIASVRDIPALQKLAQNAGLVKDSIDFAKTGANGKELINQYGKIAETAASQFQVLSNTFKTFLATLGSSEGPLLSLVKDLTGFLQTLDDIASTPVGQTVAFIVIGMTTLAAVAAIASAALFRAAAATLAVSQAATSGSGLLGLYATSLRIVTGNATAATVATEGLATSTNFLTGATEASGLAMAGASKGALLLRGGLVLIAGALALGIVNGLLKMGDAAANNELKFTGASNALKAYQQQLASYQSQSSLLGGGEMSGIGAQSTREGGALQQVTGANGAVGKVFKDAGLGNLAASYTQSAESIDKIDKSMAELVSKGDADVAAKQFARWTTAGKELGLTTKQLKALFPGYEAAIKSAGNATKQAALASDANGDGIVTLSEQYKDLVDSLFEGVNAQNAQSAALKQVGQDFVNSGAAAAFSGDSIQSYIDSVLSASATAPEAANQLQALVNALVTTGAVGSASASQLSYLQAVINTLGGSTNKGTADISAFTSGQHDAQAALDKTAASAQKAAPAIRTLVDYANDLASVTARAFDIRFSVEVAKDDYQQALADMKKGFKDARAEIAPLRNELKNAKLDLEKVSGAGDNLAKSAHGYSKAFADAFHETFVSELSDAIDKAFDTAFASQSATDKAIADAQGMAKAFKDADDNVKALRATLAGIDSDLAVATYQQGVANKYGDTLASGQLGAKISDLQVQKSKTNNDLTTATNAQSRNTAGTGDDAIANRANLQGLVSDYKDYIDTLAATGATTEEINKAITQSKKDFLDQGKALGYTDDQLSSYAAVFDKFAATVDPAATLANNAALTAQFDATTKVASATAALNDAKSRSNKTLDGNSEAARRNRAALRDLITKSDDYVKALAASGVGQDALVRDAAAMRSDLVATTTSFGLAAGDANSGVGRYAQSFRDLATAITGVPNANVKVDVSNPGGAALTEFFANFDAHNGKTSTTTHKNNVENHEKNSIDQPDKLKLIIDPSDVGLYRKAYLAGGLTSNELYAALYGVNFQKIAKSGGGGGGGGTVPRFMATGGPVNGAGGPTTDSIPIMGSNGEYMMNAKARSYYGTQFMDAINNRSLKHFATGGPVGGGANSSNFMTGIVELGPVSLGVVRQIVEKEMSVYFSDSQVAAAANRGNKQNAYRGN